LRRLFGGQGLGSCSQGESATRANTWIEPVRSVATSEPPRRRRSLCCGGRRSPQPGTSTSTSCKCVSHPLSEEPLARSRRAFRPSRPAVRRNRRWVVEPGYIRPQALEERRPALPLSARRSRSSPTPQGKAATRTRRGAGSKPSATERGISSAQRARRTVGPAAGETCHHCASKTLTPRGSSFAASRNATGGSAN